MTSSRSACATTSKRPDDDTPKVTKRLSSTEWSGSSPVADSGSKNTLAASSNDTPCLRRFVAAFWALHAKGTRNHLLHLSITPHRRAAVLKAPSWNALRSSARVLLCRRFSARRRSHASFCRASRRRRQVASGGGGPYPVRMPFRYGSSFPGSGRLFHKARRKVSRGGPSKFALPGLRSGPELPLSRIWSISVPVFVSSFPGLALRQTLGQVNATPLTI